MRDQLLGATSAGIWTARQARDAGLTADEIRGRLERGEWQVPRRGVYADSGVVLSPVMRGWAAVLAGGGADRAWATGRTTLRMFDLPLIDDDDPATGAHDHAHDDVVVRTRARDRRTLHPVVRRLQAERLTALAGCPSVDLPTAFLHAGALLTHEALVCALDAALRRELVTAREFEDFVWQQSGAPGVAVLRGALALADGRSESALETLGRLLLRPVLPDLEPQVELRDGRGWLIARFDLADERRRLAVEGDGRAAHAGRAADDQRRDRRTGARGWQTERYTWYDVRCRQVALQARIRAAAAARDVSALPLTL